MAVRPGIAFWSTALLLRTPRLAMASDPPASGALVPYTTREAGDSSENLQRWALALNPTPGRTLNEVYSAAGKALETRANRMAHHLGLGPEVVARKITSFFGAGEERELRLTALRNEVPEKLERDCFRLMGYTLPCVQPSFIVAYIHIYFPP